MVCKVKYEEPCRQYCSDWVCISEEELKLIDQERVGVDFSNEMIRIPHCAYTYFIAKKSYNFFKNIFFLLF